MPLNFNKIKNSIQDGAETIVHKSKNLAEVSSLNIKIVTHENKIKDLYKEVGEEFYKQYKDGKGENNVIIKICKEIEDINHEIKELKKRIESIKENG